MNLKVYRLLGGVFAATVCAGAHAITFSNVIIASPPLSNNSSWVASGNAISFFTPNAIVGDPTDPLRAGTLNIQYDATDFGGPGFFAVDATVNLGQILQGSGTIFFLEQVFELDANGNEIGGPIGTISAMFDANSGPFWSETIVFSRSVTNLRAKKSFTLSAPDSGAFDIAAVAQINQSIHVVPEPATMAALGLGAVALMRRRRRK
jgi:hypothetical protein